MVATYLFNFIIISAFFILLVGTVVAYIIYACFYKNQVLNIIKNDAAYNIIKNILLYSLLLSFLVFFSLFIWFYKTVLLSIGYVVFNTNSNIITNNNFLNQVLPIEFSTDLFGNILLFLAYFVGLLSIVVLDNRVFWKNIRHLFAINIFVIVVYLYVSATNIVLFFLFYEFLLLPSFLIIYFISPSRRAIQASLYFLIWTQIGSFLVLLTICYIVVIVGSADFLEIKAYNFNYETSMCIYVGLFFRIWF